MTSFRKGSSLRFSTNPPDGDIYEVLTDPYLYDRAKEDHHPPKECMSGLPKALYVAGYVDDQIIGLSVFHPYTNGYKLHFMVLKPYLLYSREFLRGSLDKFPKPIYAEIPALYRSTINFAIHEGFRGFSMSPDAFVKNGKSYDKYLLVHL